MKIRTAPPWSSSISVDAAWSRLRRQSLPRAGAQPRAAGLPERRRVARGQRPRAGQGCRQRRSGRAAQTAGRGRAAHGRRPLPARRARSRNHRNAARAALPIRSSESRRSKRTAPRRSLRSSWSRPTASSRAPLRDAGVASIRRIVRTPKRWDRIVELAAAKGHNAARRS